MEPEGTVALPTLVKRERSPDLEQVPEASSPKRCADATTGVVCAPVEFPWRVCQDLGDVDRLKIKEKAVMQAETHCERIRKALDSVLNIKHDTPEAVMMGLRIVKHWCIEHGKYYLTLCASKHLTNCRADEIRNKNKQRQILVGVEGPTGAGKSSFLGSLLRIPELFPSGQESAATAVIGKVSWNWVDDPACRFRAQVFFRHKDEIRTELASLLEELNHWTLLVEGEIDENDDDGERADTISMSRSTIEHQLPRVQAVWGLNEEQLLEIAKQCPQALSYKRAIRTIFCKNYTATKFLADGRAEFNASTVEILAESIKPFLDSSTSTYGGGNHFSAWPLVKGVHIYAKADILKPGITLVDLPGCGDAVESRSEVAEKVSHTLDVRMVVSPIIRATDEKQGQSLMRNGFDEAQMRIRGKMDGRGFCVIASKMDDMKVDSYITGCPELVHNKDMVQKQNRLADLKDEKAEIKSTRKELKSAKKKAESQRNKATKSYDKAKNKHELNLQTDPNASDAQLSTLRAQLDEKTAAFNDADKRLEQCEARSTRNSTETNYIRDWIHHRAIQTRNARVIKRLRDDFALRQSRMDNGKVSEKPKPDAEYILPILPVSTRAFWQLESNEKPMAGFPTQTCTGVPAAEKWLHRATLSKREKHLDETLDGYQNLMTMMRIYSATNGQDGDFDFTRSEVDAALAETHAFYTNIRKLDPLEHKDRAKKRFLGEAQRIVQKWAHKYPDVENNVDKMGWSTYVACIRRNGSTFKSPRIGVTYNWIENLAAPILKTLSRDWDRKMNKQLPLIKRPMMSDYSRLFAEYLNAVQRVINEKVPPLAACFANMRHILETSQRTTETKIGDVLGTVADKSAIVALNVAGYLEEEMKPTFEVALKDGGKGSFARRKETIQAKMREDDAIICEGIINRLVDGVAERIAEVPAQLRDVAAEGPRNVQQQLSFLVNNLVENCSADPAMNAKKSKVQNNIRAHIEAWEAAWAEKGNLERHILDQDLDIPDTIPEPVMEEGIDSEDEPMDDSSDSDDED
ncbi:hypothetical protein HYE67_000350 [Fusarium culmorum]|uniref:Nuclear GTPase SLIP-GC n=1 Tax=Fusarium culmorum TaxID=5516 RepID=A0A7S8HRR4_FUSCU|nr:hypothetical protein HYE67_000350 [Fusarium culmorum]